MSKCPSDREVIEDLLEENAELLQLLALYRHAICSATASAMIYLGEASNLPPKTVMAYAVTETEEAMDAIDPENISEDIIADVITIYDSMVYNSPEGVRLTLPEVLQIIRDMPYKPDEEEVIH